MRALPEIEEIRIKKQLLVAKGDIYRQSLQLQCGQLQESTAWIDRAYNFMRSTYPIYVLFAPLIGYFTFKKRKTIRGVGGKVLLGLHLFRRLRPLWEQWKSKRRSQAVES